MSSNSNFESTLNKFCTEFNEIADELQISFDTSSSLLARSLRKLKKVNTFVDHTILSMFTKDEFYEFIAAHPHLRSSLQCIFDDEVKLWLEIDSMLALTSNRTWDYGQLDAANADHGDGNGNGDTQTKSSSN